MFLRSRRSSRSVDYLLAALSPLEVSKSTRAYLESLSQDELEKLIERSVARMNDDERAYYEMSGDFATFLEQNRRALRALDHDALRAILLPVIVARSAQVEGTEDESLGTDELSASLRAALPPLSPATAWNRLTTPVKHRYNAATASVLAVDAALLGFYRAVALAPVHAARGIWRAILGVDRALAQAYRAIGAALYGAFVLAPARAARAAWRGVLDVDRALARSYRGAGQGMRRAMPVALRGVAGLGTAVAVVVAGMGIAALLVGVIVPAARGGVALLHAHPATRIAAALPVAKAAPHTTHGAPPHHPPVASAHHQAVHPVVARHQTPRPATPAPRPTATARPTATPAPVRIAKAAPPKHAAHKRATVSKRVSTEAVAAAAMPSHDAPLVQRARLIVMSYLDSLMRGDAGSALGNLGLSASAGTSNLTEAPILAGASEFRVVRATLTDAENAKVQVVIESPQGRFFGDYIVSANGPAAWITQHEVVPAGTSVARHR